MDERNALILQFNTYQSKWEDVTRQVEYYCEIANACRVKYFGNETLYWKRWKDIEIWNTPQVVNISGKVVYCNEEPQYGVIEVIQFGDKVKLFFDGHTKVVNKGVVRIDNEFAKNEGVKNLIDYLKEVAVLVPVEDGQNFLLNQLESLTVLESSVLGKFLQGTISKKEDNNIVIFPFSANLAQRDAVKKALEEDISVIKGPPGTGKTETIRNIVANYISRGNSVAVVSGNNEAVRNVKDKFESAGFGFLNAFLGKIDNVKTFFETQQSAININEKSTVKHDENELKETNDKIETCLKYSLEIAKINQFISELESERENNDAEYCKKSRNVPSNLIDKKYDSKTLLELASVLEILPKKKITGFLNRTKFLFKYGIINLKEIAKNKEDIIEYLKNKYYSVKISELKSIKTKKQEFIDVNDSEELFKKQKDLSIGILNESLAKRFKNIKKYDFSIKNYKIRFVDFTKRYPIVYSTTHAIRSCSAKNYLYDCVIIDESSQVDLISAVLAFSVAKKVVLVGDEKQLPHVVNSQLIPKLKNVFSKYELEDYFDYSKNSILSCVLKKYDNIATTLLNEHYRCDPQIIGFCNKRFYNGELVVRTPHINGNGVTIISHGSHYERNRANEREVDIIEKEIIKTLPNDQTGIIAPYNNQITLLKSRFENTECLIDTIHKFQGKEKEYIVLSTVANRIRFYDDEEKIDFLNNPNLINVAISRAKKRLYILASEETLRQEGSILRDMLKYYEYYCSETKVLKTNVYSVFDLMYEDYAPILKKMEKELLNISSFQSENIVATLIDDICKSGEYGAIGYKFNYPLKFVLKTSSIDDEEDVKFVSNINTHCDFLIYNKLNKEILMVVEVDGSQHKNEIQAKRDKRKDRLLSTAGISVLRLSTTTIDCREKIVDALKQANKKIIG